MAVKEYSKTKDGATQVGRFFRVREFACKDGSDKILIDNVTVGFLDKIRERFNAPVMVISGYRTSAYNARISGAQNSYHTRGQAADIEIPGTHPRNVAQYAEILGAPGVGLYDYGGGAGFVHVDSRPSKYYWKQTSKGGSASAVSTFLQSHPTLRKGSSGNAVKTLQDALNYAGTRPQLSTDGVFGAKTEEAVKNFQRENKLIIDGVAGSKTWGKLVVRA